MKLHLAAVLGALAIISPVYAQGTPHLGGKATLARNPVIHAIIDSNRIDVVMNDPNECSDKYLSGSFITYANNSRPDFVICMNNHDSYAELEDTIRHEAHHAVVWCNGGKPFLSWQDNLEMSQAEDVGMLYKHYKPHHHHEELEARNVARYLTNEDVAGAVRKFCM
mgnify:CR=1 FL=1